MSRPLASAARRALSAVAASLLLTGGKPAERPADVAWSHPDPGRFAVSTIAVLPVLVVEGDAHAQDLVEKLVPWKWVPTGHAWLAASSCRGALRGTGGEALLQDLADQIRRSGRVDSLATSRLAGMVPAGAYLTVRIDAWKQHERDRAQIKARSHTRVGLRVALVDSSGTLLWHIAGTELVEEPSPSPQERATLASAGSLPGGPWNPRPGALGMGLRTVSTAPPFEEVLTRLLARWRPLFLAAARRTT